MNFDEIAEFIQQWGAWSMQEVLQTKKKQCSDTSEKDERSNIDTVEGFRATIQEIYDSVSATPPTTVFNISGRFKD